MFEEKEVICLKYMVGLQNQNDGFLECIIENKEHIYEVYFSWGDIPNGRSLQTQSDEYTSFEMQIWQDKALRRLSENGIALNLLFNANCYGKDSQSRSFFYKIGNIISFIKREIPFIWHFVMQKPF